MTIAFFTIARKEISRVTRIWRQTLLPPTITTTLYFIIFGDFIGSRVGEMGGVNYMDFIAPGLIMMAIITNTYSNVASSLFSAKLQYSIEEIICSPVGRLEVLLGYAAGGMMRGIVVGCLVFMLSLLFTQIKIYNIPFLVLSVFFASFLFASLGFINGLLARKFDDVAFLPSFVLTPLIYVGGVFFSINELSSTWKFAAQFNPMLYVINLLRYCLLGKSDVNPMLAFAFLCGASLLAFAVAMHLIKTNKHLRL